MNLFDMSGRKRKMPSSKKINAKTEKVIAAEQQHIQFMSTLEHARVFWQKLKSDTVLIIDPFMTADEDPDDTFDGDINMYCKMDNICSHIRGGYNVDNSLIKYVVIPVGSLLLVGGSEIHWNCFVVELFPGIPEKPVNVTIIDPAKCANGTAVYTFNDVITTHVVKCIKTIWSQGAVFHTLALSMACQRDSLPGLPVQTDAFCQTWVVLLAEFLVRTVKKKNLELLRDFDFLVQGKKLLKTWLLCRYAQLLDGGSTWLEYMERMKMMELFDYYDPDKKSYFRASPASKVEDCMASMIQYVKDNAKFKAIIGQKIITGDGTKLVVASYDRSSQLFTLHPNNIVLTAKLVMNGRKTYIESKTLGQVSATLAV